jgi:hypothetical protein
VFDSRERHLLLESDDCFVEAEVKLRQTVSRPIYLGVGLSNLHVQLLLGLARTITFGSKSRRTHDQILLSHFRLPQPGGPGPRIHIPQDQGGLVVPPATNFPIHRLVRLASLR